MKNIYDIYILHVEAVNNSKTVEEHSLNSLYLTAWMNGVQDLGVKLSICDADNFYFNKGIDRPMCGGIWLDWTPSK